MSGCFENINFPPCEWFEGGDRKNAFASIASGILVRKLLRLTNRLLYFCCKVLTRVNKPSNLSNKILGAIAFSIIPGYKIMLFPVFHWLVDNYRRRCSLPWFYNFQPCLPYLWSCWHNFSLHVSNPFYDSCCHLSFLNFEVLDFLCVLIFNVSTIQDQYCVQRPGARWCIHQWLHGPSRCKSLAFRRLCFGFCICICRLLDSVCWLCSWW